MASKGSPRVSQGGPGLNSGGILVPFWVPILKLFLTRDARSRVWEVFLENLFQACFFKLRGAKIMDFQDCVHASSVINSKEN